MKGDRAALLDDLPAIKQQRLTKVRRFICCDSVVIRQNHVFPGEIL